MFQYLFPYDEVNKNSKILIYGGGEVGLQYLNQIALLNYCECLFIIDKNYEKMRQLAGVDVCSPEIIKNCDYDVIVIASVEYNDEIYELLRNLNIPDEKIIKKVIIADTGIQKFSSGKHWERQYATGGTSGPGSYGRLAVFKAEIINRVIDQYSIKTIIEMGCGDGNNLGIAFPDGGVVNYLGMDVAKSAIKICVEKYKNDSAKDFLHIDSEGLFQAKTGIIQADMVISMDVIFHLVEDDIFHLYMNRLFNISKNIVLIYSSNEDSAISQKHPQFRSRCFTKYIEEFFPDWQLVDFVENKYPWDPVRPYDTSMCDFFVYQVATHHK